MNNRIKVVAVEYETKDHTIWKAGVLAYDIADAIETISSNVSNYDRLVSTGITREIDIISKKVFDKFFKKSKKSTKKTVNNTQPVKNIVDTVKKEELLACPFCNRKYKTERTLLKHIKEHH